MKKRVLPILFALALIISNVCCFVFSTDAVGQYYAMGIAMDGITLDGDLSDWAGAEQYALSACGADGTWSESAYTLQVAASPDSIYVALTVPDSEKNVDGITRDQLRISVITSDGRLGLMYTDCDSWTQTSVGDLKSWWGLPETFTENAIISVNSTSKFLYNEDGTVTVESRICLKDTTAAAAEPALESGDEFRLAVQYINHEDCTSQSYSGNGRYALGTTEIVADTADEISAVFRIGEKPTQQTFTYEAVAPVGGAEMDIIEGVTDDLATDFWEWEDEEDGLWEAAPKYPMDAYDTATGLYLQSETEFVQFKYVSGQLYFRIHAKDADGKSADGLIRDGVYITVVLPGGEVGRFFLGSDPSDTVVWKEWGVESWFDSGVEDSNAKANNAIINSNSTACFHYDSGYVDVEGRVTIKDIYHHYISANTVLNVGVVYRDNTGVLATAKEGGNWAKWGTTDLTNHSAEQVTGQVTLYNPAYRDLEGIKVEEATEGAQNDTYSFDADGKLTVSVVETDGAVAYRVRIFNIFESPVTWEESDSVQMEVSGLPAGDEMIYQVIALDANNGILAAYPTVEFVVGQNPQIDEEPDDNDHVNPDEPDDPGEEPVPTNPDEEPVPTNPDEEPVPTNPNEEPNDTTGDPVLACAALMLLSSVSGVALLRKKIR